MKTKSELIDQLNKIIASDQYLLPKEHIETLHEIRRKLTNAKRKEQIIRALLTLAKFMEIIRHFFDK